MDASPILDALRDAVPGASLEAVASSVDMPTIRVGRERIVDVMRALRDAPALQFALLADVTATDALPSEPRFDVVYHLACLGEAYATGAAAPPRRLRVKVSLPGDDTQIATVTPVYPVANWLEREVYDLFGITFVGHPDLRRLLTPDDWTGHPLRKDYPVQVRKTADAWSPLQLTAEEFAENVRAQRARAAADAPNAGRARD